jgi:uncharacterized protein YjbI with pentapeptide repeats
MDTGGEQSKQPTKQPRWGFRGKTVWDWMGLLIVPLVLVVIGLVFTMLQDARQQDLENQRAEQAQKLENQRAEAERELAVQNAQDEALQAYLDQMGTLLLERDLRSSTKDNATEDSQEARTLARARTLTVLSRLDPSRKTAVLQFLVEADLVQRVDRSDPIIILRGADLREVAVFQALFHADLSGANLSGANLREADLTFTNLSEADLRVASLTDADLSGADLSGAEGLSDEELLEQEAYSLDGATMPNGQKYEDWLKDRESRKQNE